MQASQDRLTRTHNLAAGDDNSTGNEQPLCLPAHILGDADQAHDGIGHKPHADDQDSPDSQIIEQAGDKQTVQRIAIALCLGLGGGPA